MDENVGRTKTESGRERRCNYERAGEKNGLRSTEEALEEGDNLSFSADNSHFLKGILRF